MRSVIFSRAGDAATVARVANVPQAPAPGPGEVQLRVSFSPVHRGDLVGTEAASLPADESRSARLGSEAAGVVTAVGDAVRNLSVGDRVAAFPAPGAWAERVTVPVEAVVAVPEGVSDEIASVMLVNTITSRDVLRAITELRSAVNATDEAPLIVSAAASAVGKLVVRQALDQGWPVIAVVRSDRSAATVRKLFADVPVVVTGNDGWQDELRDLVDERPLPVITDAHGGGFVHEILPFLADAGTLVVWGDLTARPWTLSTSDLLMRELGVRAVSISRWMNRPAGIRAADRQAAVELAMRHPELFAVHAAYPLENLRAAVDAARTNGTGTVLFEGG
ncbi:MAG TPA: zinc-binding dehydrogenase [Pseudonocardiaceae bacterium]|jgi:NADPH:quinone reductase-like Zn-dependent oxidoreductase|nr:zinc-binding dehydrogenase [Pseudonocardiaceae bacterium]